jgi:dATP pyrophosphohydrolase
MQHTYKIPQSVLVVIHTQAMDVLLLRRADTQEDFWQSVTGSKDAEQESWVQTAGREVWEETGIDCRQGTALAASLQDWQLENVYAIYPRWAHRYAPDVTHNTERVFGLQVPVGTPVRLSPREHTDWQWLPWQQAAALCFSGSTAVAIARLERNWLQASVQYAQGAPNLEAKG